MNTLDKDIDRILSRVNIHNNNYNKNNITNKNNINNNNK